MIYLKYPLHLSMNIHAPLRATEFLPATTKR